MLEVKNLNINVSSKDILKDISFKIAESQIIQVTGRNGVGKTSFLKSLVNLLNPSSGYIYWNNIDIKSNSSNYFKNISYMSHKNYLSESLTVRENLDYFSRLFCSDYKSERFNLKLKNILSKLNLTSKLNIQSYKLSQGQKQKVSLARIFLADRKLLILDEPLVALDFESKKVFWMLIKNHLKNKGIVIFTSHQNNDIENLQIDKLDLDNYS